jgi:hypothetical protein
MVRPRDGESFLGVPATDLAAVLTPQGWDCSRVDDWGDYRLTVDSSEVAFSLDEPGWQVSITGSMTEAAADQFVARIAQQLTEATGTVTYWIRLD